MMSKQQQSQQNNDLETFQKLVAQHFRTTRNFVTEAASAEYKLSAQEVCVAIAMEAVNIAATAIVAGRLPMEAFQTRLEKFVEHRLAAIDSWKEKTGASS